MVRTDYKYKRYIPGNNDVTRKATCIIEFLKVLDDFGLAVVSDENDEHYWPNTIHAVYDWVEEYDKLHNYRSTYFLLYITYKLGLGDIDYSKVRRVDEKTYINLMRNNLVEFLWHDKEMEEWVCLMK